MYFYDTFQKEYVCAHSAYIMSTPVSEIYIRHINDHDIVKLKLFVYSSN